MRPRPRRVLPFAAGAVLVLSWTGVQGAERAVFVDGGSLVLESHRSDRGRVILELQGGGEITVPVSRIRAFVPIPPDPVEEPGPAAAAADNGERLRPEPGEGETADLSDPEVLFPRIAELALKYGLDTQLVAAVAMVESSLDPAAVSPKGAQGLMQLMPATASAYGVRNPFDAAENLEAGIAHLKKLLDLYDGDLRLALAGYNAGEAAVARYGGVPPYPETIRYVDRVMALARAR